MGQWALPPRPRSLYRSFASVYGCKALQVLNISIPALPEAWYLDEVKPLSKYAALFNRVVTT